MFKQTVRDVRDPQVDPFVGRPVGDILRAVGDRAAREIDQVHYRFERRRLSRPVSSEIRDGLTLANLHGDFVEDVAGSVVDVDVPQLEITHSLISVGYSLHRHKPCQGTP